MKQSLIILTTVLCIFFIVYIVVNPLQPRHVPQYPSVEKIK